MLRACLAVGAVCLGALTLSGCGGGPTSSSGARTPTSAAAARSHGSVSAPDGSSVQSPNGVRIDIASVSLGAPVSRQTAARAARADYTSTVVVTLKFIDVRSGTDGLNSTIAWSNPLLTFGAHKYAAVDRAAANGALPYQPVRGTSATKTYDFGLPPNSTRDHLRLTITTDPVLLEQYTFTDLQALIH